MTGHYYYNVRSIVLSSRLPILLVNMPTLIQEKIKKKNYLDTWARNGRENIQNILEKMDEIECSSAEQREELKRNRVLLQCHWLTGFRISEVLSLRRDNFRFDMSRKHDRIENVINLKQKSDSRGNLKTPLIYPKDDPFAPEVRQYVKSMKNMKYLLFPSRRVVFGWTYKIEYDRPMSRKYVWEIYKKLGVPQTHIMRHSRLTDLAAKGFNEIQLQAYSSHRSTDSLRDYVQKSPKMYEDLM